MSDNIKLKEFQCQELKDMLTSKEAYCATMNRLYRETMLPYFFYIDESGTIQIEKREILR